MRTGNAFSINIRYRFRIISNAAVATAHSHASISFESFSLRLGIKDFNCTTERVPIAVAALNNIPRAPILASCTRLCRLVARIASWMAVAETSYTANRTHITQQLQFLQSGVLLDYMDLSD